MKYLKLRISTEAKGILYEKDVEARNVFESFVRSIVGQLVNLGTIYEGEHYSAIIIPRYGDTMRRGGLLVIDGAKTAEKTDWIELRYEEPALPDQPVRYFTLELRIKERSLVYRRDFQTLDIGMEYVANGIERALVNLGVLRHGQYYFPVFYAREDDQAQFDRERIPALEEQAASLVELISDKPMRTAFDYRDVAVYANAEEVGMIGPADIRIFVRRDALERIVEEAKRTGDVERGGILVGQIYEPTDDGRRIVEISDLIAGEHTLSSVIELRYTFETWQARNATLRERFPGKRMVGWYHTHLIDLAVYTDETRTKVERTKLFFSRDDLFLHKQFFPDEWYVAMVLDPQGKSMFFQWKDGDVMACGGYRVFEDVGVAVS